MSALHKNNVRIFGAGTKNIIFSHGYGCDQQTWKAISPAFEQDYRVIVFDHMGAGASDLSQYDIDKYSTLDGYAEDLLDTCREFELGSSVYVGHSAGAMIGILAAIQDPAQFEKLVLIGASPCYINDEHYTTGFTRSDIEDLLAVMDCNYKGWAYEMAPTLMCNLERPELSAELRRSFYHNDAEIGRQFARVIFNSDYRAILSRLTVPSLITQCAMDAMAPSTVGDYLYQQLADSKMVLLQATGHYPQLSAPEEIIAAIGTFLEMTDMPPQSIEHRHDQAG